MASRHLDTIMVKDAVNYSRRWSDDFEFQHGFVVATFLDTSIPETNITLVTAAFLHRLPSLTADYGRLKKVLSARFSRDVTRQVMLLHDEHERMDNVGGEPNADALDLPTLYGHTADVAAMIQTVCTYAAEQPAAELAVYWRDRSVFFERLDYFTTFAKQAAPRLPDSLCTPLNEAVERWSARTPTRRHIADRED
jgi:hypothetical protein